MADAFWQVAVLLGQLLGFFQRQFRFALALGVEVVAQRLQLNVYFLVALFIDLCAHARQLLTVVGRQLRQLQLVHFGFARRGFGLQQGQGGLRVRGGRVGGLRLQTALHFGQRAAGIGLLLRQLAERIADFPRAILLLLQQARLFQQQTAGLQDLLFQLGGRQIVAVRQDLVAFQHQLTAQLLRHLREIVDHLLILFGASLRLFTLRQPVEGALQRLGGLRLIRRVFAAFRLLQLLFELVLGRHGGGQRRLPHQATEQKRDEKAHGVDSFRAGSVVFQRRPGFRRRPHPYG